jgi:hypothetical protein
LFIMFFTLLSTFVDFIWDRFWIDTHRGWSLRGHMSVLGCSAEKCFVHCWRCIFGFLYCQNGWRVF